SHIQLQVRNGNACLEWLPIAFPFAEGTASSNPSSSSGESGELPYGAAGSSRSRRTPARTAGPSPDSGWRHRAVTHEKPIRGEVVSELEHLGKTLQANPS